MSTIRKTVSMPQIVHESALEKMEEYGYAEFSDYIQALIRADTGVQPGSQSVLRDMPPKHPQAAIIPVAYKKKRKASSKVAMAEKKIVEAVRKDVEGLQSSNIPPKPAK